MTFVGKESGLIFKRPVGFPSNNNQAWLWTCVFLLDQTFLWVWRMIMKRITLLTDQLCWRSSKTTCIARSPWKGSLAPLWGFLCWHLNESDRMISPQSEITDSAAPLWTNTLSVRFYSHILPKQLHVSSDEIQRTTDVRDKAKFLMTRPVGKRLSSSCTWHFLCCRQSALR